MGKQQKLAYEIATALDDLDSIALHLKFVEQYSEEYLRKKLMKALAVKERDIRKSRAAIYVSQVQGYKKSNYDGSDIGD